jgi:oxygen-dependent protoporphyrinogen oxidase
VDYRVAVIGGGIAGLSAAFEIRRRRPDWEVVVLEREPVAGGKVRSSTEGGYTFDWGPNGFQEAKQTLDLVDELGLRERLVGASERARFRYLYRDGGLRRLPLEPRQFLGTELLSPMGKLRAALEPIVAAKSKGGGEETVHDFVSRHFGHEVANALAAPFVLGVAAGDARCLSVDALFPRLRLMESEHGSLLRAMGSRRGSRASGPALYSFSPGGMGELTAALAARIGSSLRAGAGVEALAPVAGGYELALGGGERVRAERVVLATPAFVSARLLAPFLAEAAEPLAAIPYVDVDLFALGFHRLDIAHPLDGFGFLVPRGEELRCLGVLWSTSLFDGRAPAGEVLLRVIAGGGVDTGFAGLDDEEALAVVARDLRLSLGITAEPAFVRRLALARALPQYEVGHSSRVDRAMRAVANRRGLVLAGNAFHGISVNDCVRDAQRVADEAIAAVPVEA